MPFGPDDYDAGDMKDAYAKGKAAGFAEALGRACLWTDNGEGVYDTGCGNAFQFTDGGVVENKQKFCGYCGGTICVVEP